MNTVYILCKTLFFVLVWMWLSGPTVRLLVGLAMFHSLSARTASPSSAAVECTSEFDKRGGIAMYIVAVVLVVIGLSVLCESDYKHALLVERKLFLDFFFF
jgi:hypothetical protein